MRLNQTSSLKEVKVYCSTLIVKDKKMMYIPLTPSSVIFGQETSINVGTSTLIWHFMTHSCSKIKNLERVLSLSLEDINSKTVTVPKRAFGIRRNLLKVSDIS